MYKWRSLIITFKKYAECHILLSSPMILHITLFATSRTQSHFTLNKFNSLPAIIILCIYFSAFVVKALTSVVKASKQLTLNVILFHLILLVWDCSTPKFLLLSALWRYVSVLM